jgi:hypothetical protein
VGTIVAAVVALLGVGLLRTVSMSQDPGYRAPWPFILGCVAVVAGLAVVALRVVPAPRTVVPEAAPPGRAVLAGAAALATLLFIGLSFPMFGGSQPAFTHGLAVLAPMAAAAWLASMSYRYLATTAASREWTPRHTLAVIGAALVAHSVGGLITVAHTNVDRIGLAVIAGVTVLITLLLDRRLGPPRRLLDGQRRRSEPRAPPKPRREHEMTTRARRCEPHPSTTPPTPYAADLKQQP